MSENGDFTSLLYIFRPLSRWWFQFFLNFHSYLGKIPILTSIFFKWVGSTTNYIMYIYITGRLLAFDILVLSCFEAEILTDADSNCRVLAATKTGETGDRVKYGCHMKSPPTSSFLFRKSHQIRP